MRTLPNSCGAVATFAIWAAATGAVDGAIAAGAGVPFDPSIVPATAVGVGPVATGITGVGAAGGGGGASTRLKVRCLP